MVVCLESVNDSSIHGLQMTSSGWQQEFTADIRHVFRNDMAGSIVHQQQRHPLIK